jgi:hypothetical protein
MLPVFPPGDGLTYEELRRTTPPAPVELRADAGQGGIRLDWKAAPLVEIEHSYSDVILYYNLFRRTGQMVDLEFLGTTEETFYIDQSAKPGVLYYYAVNAVHEGPVEGERTDPVEVLP